MSARGLSVAARPIWLLVLLLGGCGPGSTFWLVHQEQRELEIRDPSQLAKAPLPTVPPPATVTEAPPVAAPTEMSLDEAIQMALANSKAIRLLAGVTATASGQTIYDAAISNTSIDVARATFDPTITVKNTWTRFDQPGAIFDPTSPTGVSIPDATTNQYNLSAVLSQKNILGGTLSLDSELTHTRFPPTPISFSSLGISSTSPLNPQTQSPITLSYTQPLLRGANPAANIAPIVIARINTEISFFQYRDAVQELVRSTIDAYWGVVFARIDAWTKRQQVEFGQENYDRAEARHRQNLANQAEVAQTKVTLLTFKAALVGAEAAVLQREAALRNLLYLPPTEPLRIALTTPLETARVEPRWEETLLLAGERRPDLIELKLQIESDQQTWTIANNQARPQVDLVSYYRWNALEGITPSGIRLSTSPGTFADWNLGVNVSVPLGMRKDRANLRNAELTLVRDKANLDQAIHSAVHTLAGNVRNLAQYYEQYKAYKEARPAARDNLVQQRKEYFLGRVNYINVAQAISDWGNTISSEAQALAQYNTELANLERQTGTILETHGIRFMEERYRAIAPLGRCFEPKLYPAAQPPAPNTPQYPSGAEPAEKSLERERDAIAPRTPPPQMPMGRPQFLAPLAKTAL